MRTTFQRVSAGIWSVCALALVAAIVLGVLAIFGVRAADDRSNALIAQNVADTGALSGLARAVDLTHTTTQALLIGASAEETQSLITLLAGTYIRTADAGLADIQRSHADYPADAALVTSLRSTWATAQDLSARAAIAPQKLASTGAAVTTRPTQAQISTAFASFDAALDRLAERDRLNLATKQGASAAASRQTQWVLTLSVAVAVLLAILCAWVGRRRIRRALVPAEDQVRFADTMQLALDEVEAHVILKRHLERSAPGSVATVLNRNNSADRLEAVTDLPAGSPLEQTLVHARPSSCLAVRSGRGHDGDNNRPELLSCPVCGPCPGRSSCHPLTVGGMVIGSVLFTGSQPMDLSQRERVRDSVGQAAPVLANLRNLAIAEMRATTDALTALPNKRTVTDTLMRMLAQASRTLKPLCLLMLDLDHFKDVNDRFGHPATKPWPPSARHCERRSATATSPGATAARNSRSCCPTPISPARR